MKLSQFKFKLPEEKIALHPAKYRDDDGGGLFVDLLEHKVRITALFRRFHVYCRNASNTRPKWVC